MLSTEVIIIIASVAALILILIASNIRIVPQSKAWVMERIGVYSRTWHTGLHIKIPFIERAAKKVDLREQILVCGEAYNHGQYHNHRNGYEYSGRSANIEGIAAGQAFGGSVGYSDKSKKERAQARDAMGAISGRVVSAASTRETGDSEGHVTEMSQNNKFKDAAGAVLGGFDTKLERGRVSHNARVHSPKSQPVITKDNVSMEMDTVVFYQVTDPKLYAYGHATPLKAIEHIVATSLRNIVGGLELDETLTSRELINDKIRRVLDEATDAWGIKVTRVELRNIIISDAELAEAMEKQMIAERKRRADVIEAEGIRKREILVAEGEKQAKILAAEAEKQEKILKAEAEKESEILLGEGKAEQIRLINEAAPSQEYLTLKSLEAFENAAKGDSNTIIVPSELQSIAGLAKSASEVFKA